MFSKTFGYALRTAIFITIQNKGGKFFDALNAYLTGYGPSTNTSR